MDNEAVENDGKYGEIMPGFASDAASREGHMRRWSKGPFVRLKSHNARGADFCDYYTGDEQMKQAMA